MKAQPFLKWVGGKRQLLPEILPHLPPEPRVYYEPFLGGGAVFFAFAPKRAVLGDMNQRLVRTYRAIRDGVEGVIERAAPLFPEKVPPTEERYKEVRAWQNDLKTNVDAAAWLLFVNRYGYNGLYRESKSGNFNTPWNKAKRVADLGVANLRACSRVLQGVEILHGDFATLVRAAGEGDVVYCDPPYSPASGTADFTAYVKAGFGPKEQARLRDEAKAAVRRGAHVVLSNNLTEEIDELYGAPPFRIIDVKARRSVNSKADARGAVDEVVIVGEPG